MQQVTNRIRKPVRREGAEKYLLWTLLSFAGSVSVTRLFLELTGYPSIGNSELHIAHVLWGGLLLYAASLIPLLYANRWVYVVSAVFGGVGIGLFIDEVGKFITQSNDYFYPPAAPIIYAFFLITVLIYSRIRRPRNRDVRSELYSILDGLEEVLDHDLTDAEQKRLIARLDILSKEDIHPDLKRLILSLRSFTAEGDLYLAPEKPGFLDRWLARLQAFEKHHSNRKIYRGFLVGSLVGIGLWSLYYPTILAIYLADPSQTQSEIIRLLQDQLISNQAGLNWFEARLTLQAVVGLILFIAAFLIVIRREKRGVQYGYLGLLLSLTTVNLLIFYFDQFSTIILAMLQTSIFLVLLYYRQKYLPSITSVRDKREPGCFRRQSRPKHPGIPFSFYRSRIHDK